MLEGRYRQYKQLAFTITKGDERHLDLLHDVLIQLETNEKWNNLKTKQEQMYFLTRALSNQYYSNNSSFKRTYKRFNADLIQGLEGLEIIDEPYSEKPSIEWIKNLLDNELKVNPDNWYNIGLFKLYLEHKKIEPIHKKTKIPKYSIRETIKQMKSFIKFKWEQQCQ